MIQAKKKMKFRKFIFPLLLFFATIVMSVGFASINSITLELNGSTTAKLQGEIFITDIDYYSSVRNEYAASKINNFYSTVVSSEISLTEDLRSSITYEVSLYNYTNSVYTYMGLNYDDYFYSNPDIVASVSGINVGDKVLGKSHLTVYLTFSYKEGVSNPSSNILDSYVNFLFDKLPPEFTVLGNPTNWTNQDVTLEIVPANNISVDFYEYSFDGGNTWQSSPTKTYSDNVSNIEILIRDFDGITSSVYTTDITKIDKKKPTIEVDPSIFSDTIVTLGESFVLKDHITVADDQSDIDESTYVVTRLGNAITNTTYFSTVGYYEVIVNVSDNAGNSHSVSWPILVRWPVGAKYILAKHGTVASGDGLYADTAETGLDESLPYTSEYYFRGASVNNYFNFSNTTWRVMYLSQNNTIKLFRTVIGSTFRYSSIVVTNNFFSSNTRLRKTMQDWSSSGNINGEITLDLSKVADGVFYVGSVKRYDGHSLLYEINQERTDTERTGNDGTVWNNRVGLPTVTEFLKSSTSPNIVNVQSMYGSGGGSEYTSTSWMIPGDSTWTLTAHYSGTNDYWYYSNSDDNFETAGAYASKKGVAPCIFIKGDSIISGTGTSGDPFVIQENWDWFDSVEKANLR